MSSGLPPESGHCSIQSACLKRASLRHQATSNSRLVRYPLSSPKLIKITNFSFNRVGGTYPKRWAKVQPTSVSFLSRPTCKGMDQFDFDECQTFNSGDLTDKVGHIGAIRTSPLKANGIASYAEMPPLSLFALQIM